MAKRFPADPNSDLKKAAEEYHDAMRQVAAQFPDDLDAATLCESGKTVTFAGPMGSPIKRAECSLPPIAKSVRPNRVWCATT